jgi:hypothetical protein
MRDKRHSSPVVFRGVSCNDRINSTAFSNSSTDTWADSGTLDDTTPGTNHQAIALSQSDPDNRSFYATNG